MEKLASEMMGENVTVGVTLDSQAAVKKAVKNLGVIGKGLMQNLAPGTELKETTSPGNHTGSCYVAIGDNNVAFFTVKQGLFKNSLGDLLAKHPRSEVSAMEIESGMMSTVHVVLQDGTHYVLLCAKMNQKNLGRVKEALFPQ